MFSKFFIEHPVFSSVISIIIVLGGFMGLQNLPVEEYPSLTPPQIVIEASYPGADAATIAKSVAAPLEDAINGVENMLYMQSKSSSSGAISINVFFEIGTDSMKASMDINNRVSSVEAKLPEEVRRRGVKVSERSSNILEVVTFYSPNGNMDPVTLNNYVNINITEELKRVNGVGNVAVFGGKDYSIRIWIKPELLTKHNITPLDIINTVKEQNSQYAAGKIGQMPTSQNSPYVYTLKFKGRLESVKEFENIILKSNGNGNILKLKDVADVELGAQSYSFQGKHNGTQDMIPMLIFTQNKANAIATAKAVEQKLKVMSKDFPSSLTYSIPYDTTKFVEVSIQEVGKTFVEAILLVLIVMYLFLKNFRATIIPMIAVPVSILGTFGILYILGFSLNLITLFALLLAIGIVVDDAIIVIENVERILRAKHDISPKEAAIGAMREVSTPIISIVLVLCAVFIPVAFLGGFTGQIQKEFALTLVSSVVISGFVALTLTPALCGVFLKHGELKPFWLVRKFNDFFDWSTNIFSTGVSKILRHIIPSLMVVAILFFTTYKFLALIPTSLVPKEDKGAVMVFTSLAPGTTLANTSKEIAKISGAIMQNPNFKEMASMIGYDMQSGSLKESSAISFINLKDWSKRADANASTYAFANTYNKKFFLNPGSQTFFVNPPAIRGMGLSGGFSVYLQNKNGKSYEEIAADMQRLLANARKRPELNPMRTYTTLVTNVPQYNVHVNREKAKMLGINMKDIFATLNTTMGGYYINDFNMFGKTYQVKVRAKDVYRDNINDIKNIHVKSRDGKLVPLTSILSFEKSTGPSTVERFNLYPAAKVSGSANAGYTSGDAIRTIQEVVAETFGKNEYSLGWSGASFQEVSSAGGGAQAFIFGLVFVFLILAAQYERWLVPFAVLLAVPFAVLGSLIAIYLRGLSNDIYFQIGLLVLIGLSAKNAILIIEFAMEAKKRGLSIFDASIEASRLRFRPIIMTSLAFTFGVFPMVISTGAGAASRHALGTGVVGGMILASSIALFFIPLFYYIFEKLSDKIAFKRE